MNLEKVHKFKKTSQNFKNIHTFAKRIFNSRIRVFEKKAAKSVQKTKPKRKTSRSFQNRIDPIPRPMRCETSEHSAIHILWASLLQARAPLYFFITFLLLISFSAFIWFKNIRDLKIVLNFCKLSQFWMVTNSGVFVFLFLKNIYF